MCSTHRGGKNAYIMGRNPERKRKLLDLGMDRLTCKRSSEAEDRVQ
jgi:hypothetical protein